MSNYEQYAEKKQPELLQKSCTLGDCINRLKENSSIFSINCMEEQIGFVASLFDLLPAEVKRAVEGDEYWCV